ncbi:MAG: hypothetical protein WAL73_08780, partial [Terracidiphilus sp.]
MRLRLLLPSPSGLPTGFPTLEDACLAVATLSARSPCLHPGQKRPFQLLPAIVASFEVELPAPPGCYASCLILIASAHFAGRLRQRANPPLQPSLHERKSQVKPATNVCIQQNFASPCSAEDEFPTSSNLFPAAFAAGDNPI